MKSIIEQIQEDDPNYAPFKQACEAAGIEYDLAKAALDRVVMDGFYGPLSNSDWEEQDGRRPFSVSEGLEILAKVSEEVTGYNELFVDEDEEGHEVQWKEETFDSSTIKRDLFCRVIEIYGGLPW